jgi:hypothetical protein
MLQTRNPLIRAFRRFGGRGWLNRQLNRSRKHADWTFPFGSSGPFGEDLPGRWLDHDELITTRWSALGARQCPAKRAQRPTMKFVATKTAEQLDLQTLHRVRERLVSQRTGIINQIRAFLLERGVAVRQGLRFLRAELPRILATPCDVLSPRMVHPLLLRQRYGEQSWRGRNAGRRPAAKIVRNLPEPAVLTGGLLSSRPLLIDP